MAPLEEESVNQTLEQPPSTVDSSVSVQSSSSDSLSRNGSTGKKLLNAKAPEFVPRTNSSNGRTTDLLQQQPSRTVIQQIQMFPSPIHHQYQNYGFGGGVGDHDVVGHTPVQDPDPVPRTSNGLSEEKSLKIVKQVEYYFSDANLATTEHLIRFINKDQEGFVPISVVASFKKIKALISGHAQLAYVLKSSSKLVVSEDGKKVRQQDPITESDMEKLQSRIIIAENLPEDHSYQNLMRVFSAVGSVKTIRTCQPQPSNGGGGGGGASATSKSGKAENMLYSNKLHAFVEYETVELAEKAVAEFNDESNWRSGLRVRILLKRTSKPTQAQGRKAVLEDKEIGEEENIPIYVQQPNEKQHPNDPCQSVSAATLNERVGEGTDKDGGQPKKGRACGRAKGRDRGQGQYHHNGHHNNHHSNHRNGHIGTPPSTNSFQKEHPTLVTKQPPGPRMPDGTKGFAMGRGKPLLTRTA